MFGWSGNFRGIMVIKYLVTQALKATVKKASSKAAKIKWYQKAAEKKIYSKDFYKGYKPPKSKGKD